jgi:hypothetical protein
MLLSNDVVEVACDALWFVKGQAVADDAQERAWTRLRLQESRSGDLAGSGSAELTSNEANAIARALRVCADTTPLDESEHRLLLRLDPG